MPYNGRKADEARQRLLDAVFRAQGQGFESGAPIIGPMQVTSGYGPRIHPILGRASMHSGADLAAPIGTPVYATEDGYISQAQHKSSGSPRGNNVVITHPGGQKTEYAHLDRFGQAALRGGAVKRGDVIGYSGTTGRSTGPHLHYGLYDEAGRSRDPIKPIRKRTQLASK